MKRVRVFQAVVGVLFLLLLAVFFVKVGWVLVGETNVDFERMGYCFDVGTDKDGKRLFVAAGERGLHIFDLAKGDMEYSSSYYDDGYYRNLKVLGNRAFIADSRRGLVVLDIIGPTPRTVWVEGDEGGAGGERIEIATTIENGLHIMDVKDPRVPLRISKVNFLGWVEGVFVAEDFAYVANGFNGVRSIDIHDIHNPLLVDSFLSLP
jgi:hypothetical protein